MQYTGYEDLQTVLRYLFEGVDVTIMAALRRKLEDQQCIEAAASKADIRVIDPNVEADAARVNPRKRGSAFINRQTARGK